MSYLIVGVLGLLIAILLVASFVKPKKGAEPTTTSSNGITPNLPAADEPTPDRSTTAPSAQVEKARPKTPSA